MRLWRIATETRSYKADDLSGTGSSLQPGRWNDAGEFVVYSAPTIAMAVIETAAHLPGTGFPQNRFIVEIDVPDAVWAARTVLDLNKVSPAWSSIPAGQTSVDIGSAWLAAGTSAILVVRSAIVREEDVTLINPRHPMAALIKANVLRAFDYRMMLGRSV